MERIFQKDNPDTKPIEAYFFQCNSPAIQQHRNEYPTAHETTTSAIEQTCHSFLCCFLAAMIAQPASLVAASLLKPDPVQYFRAAPEQHQGLLLSRPGVYRYQLLQRYLQLDLQKHHSSHHEYQ